MRAAQLRDLADQLEIVLDAAAKAAATSSWDCPNADDVRGAMSLHQGAARAAAADLREEAMSMDAAEQRARDRAAETAGATS